MEDIVKNAHGVPGLFVPFDHPGVLQCRPAQYLYSSVKQRILADIEAIDGWLEACHGFINAPEFDEIGAERAEDGTPYWNNDFFNGDDARFLAAMLRHFRPRRYVEIGCGNSTKFARWTIDRWGLPTRITCVDPAPREEVAGIPDEFVAKSLLEVENDRFATLESGDILFHDGSHIVFNGTDTTKLVLEILPLIKSGVVLHIHDISLPWEYVSSFDNRGYNEQYLLAAMLLFGTEWEVLAPVTYLHRTGRLKEGGTSFGTSFWMRKR
jgi:hypothetical protein